jgi:hypothetical protein
MNNALSTIAMLAVGVYAINRLSGSKRESMDIMADMDRLVAPVTTTVQELARETRESTSETGKIEQVEPYYRDREEFLTNVVAMPDVARSTFQPREEFYMAAHETENPWEPLLNTKPYEALESRQEQIDRVGAVGYKDFMDTDGNFPNTYSTGVEWQDKGTPYEAIASQPDPVALSEYMPQVVRKNADINPASVITPVGMGAFLPPRSTEDRHMRRTIDIVRNTGVTANIYPSGADRAQESTKKQRDNREFENPRLGEQRSAVPDGTPYIDERYREDMPDKRDVMEAGINLRGPTMSGAGTMFAPTISSMYSEERRPRRKYDESIRSSRPVAYVGGSRASMQTAMYGRARDNDRDSESFHLRSVLPLVQPQFSTQSRTRESGGFGGKRVEGAGYFVPAAANAFDKFIKPDTWGAVIGNANDALPGTTMDLDDTVAQL